MLLKQGADANVQGGWYGNTPQAASREGHDAVARLLLEHGADVNMQGEVYGNTLKAARRYGDTLIVQLLLEHGCIDEDSEDLNENSKHRKIDEQGDGVDGSVEIEGDECGAADGLEEEWASAEEHPEEST